MNNKEELLDQVFKVAKMASQRTARIHRNIVSSDDVYQHLNLWALEHWHKIEEWENQESLVFKLRRTFNNEGQKFAAKERAYKSRSSTSDAFYYTHEVLQELLKDVWSYEYWVQSSSPVDTEFITRSTKPSEGNNRLALLSDVAESLKRLNETDRQLLRRRFDDGTTDFDVLAVEYGASEDAIRKRVSRAITKLQERLGGDAPVWNNRRYSKSNAQAQAELKEQE
jgi:DNA-directed RNA polymerase specialized sigma24 family protein